jgi:hypothetical protein
MKKLLTILFSAVLVFSLAMPVFAQDASQDAAASAKPKKEKKMKKAKKEKKAKKDKAKSDQPAQ